jgi:hypothetical protein
LRFYRRRAPGVAHDSVTDDLPVLLLGRHGERKLWSRQIPKGS